MESSGITQNSLDEDLSLTIDHGRGFEATNGSDLIFDVRFPEMSQGLHQLKQEKKLQYIKKFFSKFYFKKHAPLQFTGGK